jgi:D-glycero-alpha-D-manno-heptose-7-phosphate kinase
MIVTRTPYRVSFFGGGTDYNQWYLKHGGRVLTSTIDKYCHLSARWLPPFFEHRHRIVWSKIETPSAVGDIEHPSVRACLQRLRIEQGVEIHHWGDLPAKSGLGSSSAFTVGLLNALTGLIRSPLNKDALACAAINVEQGILREVVGVQDQIECAHGGLNEIILRQDDTFEVVPVNIQGDRMLELQSHLMLFFTGFQRFAPEVAKDQIARMDDNDAQLRAIASMVPHAVGILKGTGRLEPFGELLHDSWLLKRGLSPGVSTHAIDQIYQAAVEAGALGGKLLGAGGGGFMLLFAKPEHQGYVRSALCKLVEIPFRFEVMGTHVIHASE